MSGHMHVETSELRGIAGKLAGQHWSSYQNPPSPADQLPLSSDAVSNLNQNAQTLEGFQGVAEAQCKYLAETFGNVATAYEKVDQNAATAIVGSEARATAVEAIPIPRASTQLPAIPDGPSLTGLNAGGYAGVEETQAAITAPDGGASLRAAASDYRMRGQLVGSHAEEKYPTSWEGDAAEAAYTRLNEYSNWLRDLESAWGRLEQAATKLADAHETAAAAHTFVAWLYALDMQQLQALNGQPATPENQAKARQLQEGLLKLTQASEKVRDEYANAATFDPVKPSDPPFGSRGGGGSTGGNGNGGSGGGATGSGGGGGGASGASGATMPQSAGAQNAAQTTGAEGAGSTGSGSGSGGGSEGGSPSGGGSPAGGAGGATGGLPGGLPDGGTGMPTPTDDPSLHPAGADGGGGGGSGGGGGGGLGPTPLQPNLGHSGVGPGPAAGGVSGGGGPAAASATGGMGMGGGAPMHGGGHGQGGEKEKKRNPLLAPDENIYAEEREWTEPVIGQRRRTVADTSKDTK